MKEIVGGSPEKDYGVFNNFREKTESISIGLMTGGMAVLAFALAADIPSILPVALAAVVGFGMQVLINPGNPKAQLKFTSKNKPLFVSGLVAPLIIAGGMTVDMITDNQERIIEQNNRILEQVEPFKAFEPKTITL